MMLPPRTSSFYKIVQDILNKSHLLLKLSPFEMLPLEIQIILTHTYSLRDEMLQVTDLTESGERREVGGFQDPELSRWRSLLCNSKAAGETITDCLLSAHDALTKCRAIEDKRSTFKETGDCWLTLINRSTVLRGRKKPHGNLVHLKAEENQWRNINLLWEMLSISWLEINENQIIKSCCENRIKHMIHSAKGGDQLGNGKYRKWEWKEMRKLVTL